MWQFLVCFSLREHKGNPRHTSFVFSGFRPSSTKLHRDALPPLGHPPPHALFFPIRLFQTGPKYRKKGVFLSRIAPSEPSIFLSP